MRKRIVNKLIRDEKGQALIIVVILMLFGSLIVAPLLGYMRTGLIVGKAFEVKMEGLYAADAGIENAVWKLINGEIDPACDLTDVNGMDVTVDELIPPVQTDDGIIYTLQSTAYLAGETKAETVAQVLVTGGSIEEGGEGGDYRTNEDTVALSLIGLIDDNTIIFSTKNKSIFWGREDDRDGPGTAIEPEDLGLLNMATGTGALYLDGDARGLLGNPKYEFYSVHYYQDGGNDYLLMSIKTDADVGAIPFTSSDIISLQVDVNYDNPAHPFVQSATVDPDPLHTIPGANVVALSRRDDGTILFSFSNPSVTLGSDTFERGQVIKYDPGTGYSLLFDAKYILLGNPNLELDCLAILEESDPRMLLSFTDDSGATGSDGKEIEAEDFAIWNPGDPDDPDDDTIILHISMCEDTFVTGAERTVSIISWEVSP